MDAIEAYTPAALWLAGGGAVLAFLVSFWRIGADEYGERFISRHSGGGLLIAAVCFVYLYTAGRYLLFVTRTAPGRPDVIWPALAVVLLLPLTPVIRWLGDKLFPHDRYEENPGPALVNALWLASIGALVFSVGWWHLKLRSFAQFMEPAPGGWWLKGALAGTAVTLVTVAVMQLVNYQRRSHHFEPSRKPVVTMYVVLLACTGVLLWQVSLEMNVSFTSPLVAFDHWAPGSLADAVRTAVPE